MTIQSPREMLAAVIDALHAKEKAEQLAAFDAAFGLASDAPPERKKYTRKMKAKPVDVPAEGGGA